MKQLVKRYRVFLILLAVQVLLMAVSPKVGWNSVENIKSNVRQMLGVIPPVFILLGLLDVWVDRPTMIKYTGPGSGIRGALISFFLGSAAAGPLYAAFPIADTMLQKGSSLFNVFLFLGAWSTTKIPMLTFEAGSLGVPFMAARLCMSLLGILLIAAIVNKAAPRQGEKS